MLACAPSSPPTQPQAKDQPAPELTVLPWYAQSTDELAALNRRAADLLQAGQFDQASAIVTQSQPLAAMEAAADHDDLSGRLYIHNQRWGWARMTFQKNLIRWKAWKPQTPETAARIKAASEAVAECDKHM